MTFQPGANLYTQGFASRPESVEVPHYDVRAPGSTDVNYPIGKSWIDYVHNNAYILTGLSTSAGITTATWVENAPSGGALNTLSDDSSTIVNPVSNNIQLAGTSSQIATTAGTGVITFSLIGPYTPATYPAHSVLLGEGSSSISSVGPNAASGKPLISQGLSSDPIFGTAVVAGGGTGATTLTAHAVLLGEGTSPVSSVGPNSASGIPLISQGASSDPIFGTAVVAGGGTGATTLTAHGVLLGEGTSAVLAVGPNSASGIPLISQGASADPIYGTATVPGGGTGATTLTSHGVLLGNGTSAVTATTAGTNGQVLLGSTGAAPAFGTLTTSTGVNYTTGAASLAIDVISGGFKINAASTGVALVAQNAYTVTQAAQTSFSLPATAAVGDRFAIASATGNTSGWIITQGSGQIIYANTSHTTSGATGTLAGAIHCAVEIMCVLANTEFIVMGGTGLTGLTFT